MSGRRLVAAFVRLHWRQLVNALQGRRRGLGAKIGAWAQVVVQALLVLVFLSLALGVSAALAFAGHSLTDGGTGTDGPLLALRVALFLVVVLTLVLAALRAGVTGVQGLERLLLLPLSARTLHRLAAIPFVADPWLLAMLPGLLILAAFLLRRGAPAGAVALAAGLLFLLAAGALASAVGHAVRLLLRDRRRAETVLAIALVGLILLSLAPGLLEGIRDARRSPEPPPAPQAEAGTGEQTEVPEEAEPRPEGAGRTAEPTRRRADLGALANRFPWPLQAVPSEAYVRAVERATHGAPAAALPSLAALALVLGSAWTLSLRLWQRLATSPSIGGRRDRPRVSAAPGVIAAGAGSVGGASRAVAEAFTRGSLRTVQGKLALITPPIAIGALSVMGKAAEGPFAGWMQGPALLIAAGFMALTVNQNALLNMLGVDRSGLALELLSPLTGRQILLGRALGGAMLTAASFVPALAAHLLVSGGSPPALVAAALLGLVAAYSLFFPLAAWLSLLFAKAADLGKVGQEGKPQPIAVVLGLLGVGVVLAVAGMAGFAGSLAAGPAGALAAEALFAAVALLLFPLLLAWTAAGLEMRREAVYLAVRGG